MKLLLQSIEGEQDSNIICSITDRKGVILYANSNFCDISGYDSTELVGSNHNIVNSGFHGRDFFTDMWKTISNGQIWQGEVKNKNKCGDFYWVDTIIFPIGYSEDSKAHYLSVRTLIDDKKHAEKRKEERIEELQNLLHTISHQMRQPITQIMGLIEILKQVGNLTDELEELVLMLNNSAKKLNEYTIDLTRQVDFIAKRDKIN